MDIGSRAKPELNLLIYWEAAINSADLKAFLYNELKDCGYKINIKQNEADSSEELGIDINIVGCHWVLYAISR